VATQLKSKPGLSGATALSIPKDWDPTWFRHFIHNQLKGADVRNAVGASGITVSGTIASPYATIGFGAPVTLPGPVNITAPVSGIALTVTGASGSAAVSIVGAASGTSDGLVVTAGISSSDIVFLVRAVSGAPTFMEIFGDGHGTLGPSASLGFSWAAAGNITIAAPSSGDTLALNRTGDGTIIDLVRSGTTSGQIGYGDAFVAGQLEIFSNGTVPLGIGTVGSAAVHIYANSITAVTVSSAGNVTIAAPTSGQTLTVAPSPSAGELIATSSALTTGAGAAVGTLTNAPSAGNPTKWIKINDNGTVRSVPAW
jgi:hypothetical protein